MGLWSKGLERAQTGEERLGDMYYTHNDILVLDKVKKFIKDILDNTHFGFGKLLGHYENEVSYSLEHELISWKIRYREIKMVIDKSMGDVTCQSVLKVIANELFSDTQVPYYDTGIKYLYKTISRNWKYKTDESKLMDTTPLDINEIYK